MTFLIRLNALLALGSLLALMVVASGRSSFPLGTAAGALDWPPNCKSCTSYEKKTSRVAVLRAANGTPT